MMKQKFSRLLVVALLAPLLLLAGARGLGAQDGPPPSPSPSPQPAASETWFTIRVAGQPAGWAVERTSVDDDGHLVTADEQRFRLARGEVELEMGLETRFVETADGKPVSLAIVQNMGGGPLVTRYRFLEDGRVEIVTGSGEGAGDGDGDGDGARREIVDGPAGDWLTPGEEAREIERLHGSGAESYRITSLVPSDGLTPVTLERTLVARDTTLAGLDGVTGDLWSEETSNAPGVVTQSLMDASGNSLGSSARIFGLELVIERTDRATALAGLDGNRAPEIMISSLVRPDRPIDDPRGLRRAVYDLTLDPEAGRPFPALEETSVQRVERIPGDDGDRPRGLRVTVDRTGSPPILDTPAPEFLASTPYLSHDDPALTALAERGLASLSDRDGTPTDAERSETLRQFVYRYVSDKSFDHGFATAAQVAETRAGDCTEHGVLLAALLRAADIPSRVVTGVVYVDDFQGAEGSFGYHLWTQAFVDGRWLDLDPSFPGSFDATHIAFATSPLSGDQAASTAFANLITLMGDLEIRVVETEGAKWKKQYR